MIERRIVGVKVPESATAEEVEVGVDLGVAVGEAVGDGLGVGVGEAVGEADGVDSKAGPSAA